MRITQIFINGPSNGALRNCGHLCTLKFVDKMPPFLTGPHKVLFEIQHGNRTKIINTNRNSISVKLSLERLATGVVITSCASYVQ